MKALDFIEPVFLGAVDGVFAHLPQPIPSKERLESVTIFSHRGEHDNNGVMENTLAAFSAASAAGVGGLEFDVRWTKDIIPVVFHDADLARLYNLPQKIKNCSMTELRRKIPNIPTLEEVVSTFGQRLQLMIELKLEHFPDPKEQSLRLKNVLKILAPGNDFYLISLHPQVFQVFSGFPSGTYLPIARTKACLFSRLSLNETLGGLTGHYTFITDRMITRHHRVAQKIGTGFIHSRYSLFREINRGVDWIFSNRAVWLQKMVNDLLGCDKLSKT